MEKRKLEKLGIETSLLGFGCMRFPTLADGKIDEAEAERMLDRAIGAGVNYIDTAYPYHNGQSEPVVGRILKKYDRNSFFLATKLPLWAVNSVEDAERIFNDQLERLQTDHIDFYLLHAVNKEKWDQMKELGVVDYCARLKEEGKIRYYGFSFHDDYEVFEEILRYRDWDFCQIQYNYINTNYQAGTEGLKYAASKGLGVVVMEPLLGGKLANLAEHVAEVVPDKKSQVEYALDFLWDQPEVSLLLSGMTEPEQVEQNLEYASRSEIGMVTEEDRQVYAKAKEIFDKMALVNCTKCAYCMPCPFGLNIPELFAAYNMTASDGMAKAKEAYGALETKADACRACHHCEQECPQHIKISEIMPKVAAAFA